MKKIISVSLAVLFLLGMFIIPSGAASGNLFRVNISDAYKNLGKGYVDGWATKSWWVDDADHMYVSGHKDIADLMKDGNLSFLSQSSVTGAKTDVMRLKGNLGTHVRFPLAIQPGHTYKFSFRIMWDKSSKDLTDGTFQVSMGADNSFHDPDAGRNTAYIDAMTDLKKTIVNKPEYSDKHEAAGWYLIGDLTGGSNVPGTWYNVSIQFTIPNNVQGFKDKPYIGIGIYQAVDATDMYFDSFVIVDVNDDSAGKTPAPTAKPAPDIKVLYQGKEISFGATKPVIENGSTLVPLRAIFEALGATVDYANGNITAKKGDTIVKLTVGSKNATVSGKAVTLAVPAKVVNGSTLVPLRFIGEAFGNKVDWNGTTYTVTIS